MVELSSIPRPVVRYAVGVWRRRWVAAGVAWALALLLWFAVWLLPDQYESRAQVFVQTETILDPVMTGVTARPNYERRVEVMRSQLLTRPNVEEVIYRAGLDREITATNPVARQAELQRLTDWIAGKIDIDSAQEMYFIITFRYGEPVIARNVVDAVLNLLIEQDLGASLNESQEARRRLDMEIASYNERLSEMEADVAAFRRDHAAELAVVEGRLRRRDRIEADLSRLGDDLATAKRRVTTLESILSTTPKTTSGTELDKLLVELATLTSQYEESHPDIRMVRARIEELSGEGGADLPDNPEYRRVLNDLRGARDALAGIEQRERELRAEAETLAFTAGQAPGAQAELQRIERDYEQTRKSYEELARRRERLALTESLGGGAKGVDYKIYERPEIAIKPAAPPRLLLILAALALAAGGGVAAAGLVTHFDRTFTQTGDLEARFGLPVLGAISEAGAGVAAVRRRADLARLGVALAALFVLGGAYLYWEVFRLPNVAVSDALSGERAAVVEAPRDARRGDGGAQSATTGSRVAPRTAGRGGVPKRESTIWG